MNWYSLPLNGTTLLVLGILCAVLGLLFARPAVKTARSHKKLLKTPNIVSVPKALPKPFWVNSTASALLLIAAVVLIYFGIPWENQRVAVPVSQPPPFTSIGLNQPAPSLAPALKTSAENEELANLQKKQEAQEKEISALKRKVESLNSFVRSRVKQTEENKPEIKRAQAKHGHIIYLSTLTPEIQALRHKLGLDKKRRVP